MRRMSAPLPPALLLRAGDSAHCSAVGTMRRPRYILRGHGGTARRLSLAKVPGARLSEFSAREPGCDAPPSRSHAAKGAFMLVKKENRAAKMGRFWGGRLGKLGLSGFCRLWPTV